MDSSEFELAVRRVRPRMMAIARRIVGRDDADDVVQNTVTSVWQRRDRVQDLDAYLIQQVGDDARDYAKGAQREQSTGAYLDREDPRPDPIDEDVLVRRIAVRQALDGLPADIRHAVWAIYAEGATWREVAAELGVDKQTLHRRVSKWLPTLRSVLGETDGPASSALSREDER